MRVDQPFALAEFVLGQQGYDEERMRGMIGKGERTIRLKTELPVHLTYFTVFVDENGRLQRREDIYGYDGRVKTALGLIGGRPPLRALALKLRAAPRKRGVAKAARFWQGARKRRGQKGRSAAGA